MLSSLGSASRYSMTRLAFSRQSERKWPVRGRTSERLGALGHQRREELDVLALELADLEPVAELGSGVDVAGAHPAGNQHRVVNLEARLRQERLEPGPFVIASRHMCGEMMQAERKFALVIGKEV